MSSFLFESTCPQNPPSTKDFLPVIEDVIKVLQKEDQSVRPKANNKKPGGIINLIQGIPTILVPDLHSRYDFLVKILNYRPSNFSVLELLEKGLVNLLFVGDGLHSERAGLERWNSAYDDFLSGNFKGKAMTEEMSLGLNLMFLVMKLKIAFPRHVHFLKGNHENILNDDENGNYPFRKFVDEGQMSYEFMKATYPEKLIKNYAVFENLLPVFAVGSDFLVSHAEPARYFSKTEILNCYQHPSVITGLIWTRNDEALGNPAIQLLDEYFPENPSSLYFAGHRPVKEKFALREEGRFVQIHNPEKKQIIILNPNDAKNFRDGIINLDEV
ncbi:MAG: metallophosphoesterase [Treponemataceae bacterium]|nr:metallophosphoesterase [Treponemataceae bacterium]